MFRGEFETLLDLHLIIIHRGVDIFQPLCYNKVEERENLSILYLTNSMNYSIIDLSLLILISRRFWI